MSSATLSAKHSGTVSRRYAQEDDPYPLIRSALAPEYLDLPAEDVEALLARNGLHAEAMEGFLSDVGNWFKKAAPAVGQVAARALPGILSGAATGSALGPWGALAGAVLGGVTSAVASGGGSSPRAPARGGSGGPLSAVAGALPALAGLAGGGSAGSIASTLASAAPTIAGLVGGGGSPASGVRPSAPGQGAGPTSNPAGVLLGLFQRPELQQALMSMALGSAGARTVPAGPSSTPVPVSGFANLLSALASQAFAQSEATAEPSESYPEYLYKNDELAADPAMPEARAARLLEMLGETTPVPQISKRRRMYTEADEYYDDLDIAELDSMDLEGDAEFDSEFEGEIDE